MRGQVVVVGEDRVVIQSEEGGQVTLEVGQVKDGEAFVPDGAQLEQIKTLEVGQEIEVNWGQDHTGHYYIVDITADAGEERARQGLVRGQVIATSEGRVVVADAEGGQMTLEPNWIRRNGEWVQDPFCGVFAAGLNPGDEIIAMWMLDEGTHYVVRGISKIDPEGQALALTLMQSQLRENYQQINQLQDQIGNLQHLVQQLVDAKDQ